MPRPSLALVLAAFALAPPASAQFGNAWLTLVQNDGVLKDANGQPHSMLTDTREKDFAVGDLNFDGLPDLVVVRKEPASFPGKEASYLFLNENGSLVERTQQYSSSTTPGDLGLLRPTDTRDAEIADLDGDGWLDIAQCQIDLTNSTTAADKVVTHPRIHINQRVLSGSWLGVRHEDNRVPQLLSVSGINGVVRFPDLTAGDSDTDGDLDLYFVDYDNDENGHTEPSNLDLNDRLLINDGNGFFTDETQLHLTATMAKSAYGTECQFADMNADGRLDIVKISTLFESPNAVKIVYNDATPTLPNGTGNYDALQTANTDEVYSMAVADLNQDGRLDLAIGSDLSDRFLLNLGTAFVSNVVSWSPATLFTWLSGSLSQAFPGQMYARDYDGDGWNDVLTCDVDIDLLGCNRRTQIFHNHGGTPGTTSLALVEEKQQTGTGGWFGVVGWSNSYPKGVFDAANIDIDRDGDLDIILGMCSGTDVWFNQSITGQVCQNVVALGGKGSATLSLCGGDLSSGNNATIKVVGGSVNGLAILFASTTLNAVAGFGGTLWTHPIVNLALHPLDALGNLALPAIGGGGPQTWYLQALTVPPAGSAPDGITNVLEVVLKP